MSLVFLSTMLSAQNPVEIKLWPNGAPNSNHMTQQVENGPLYVAEPTLTVYLAKEGNGMAIVACPGGGYTHLAMQHEGHDMANWFNSQGITYAVLTYRMPNGNDEVPLSDAQQALRIMRQHADEWNIRQLGIMGASAGGHLASTVATHLPMQLRVPTSRYCSTLSLPWTRRIPTWALTITYWEKSFEGTRTEIFQRTTGHSANPSCLYHAQQRRRYRTRSQQRKLLSGTGQEQSSRLPAHLSYRWPRMGIPRLVYLQTPVDRRTGKMAS